MRLNTYPYPGLQEIVSANAYGGSGLTPTINMQIIALMFFLSAVILSSKMATTLQRGRTGGFHSLSRRAVI